jgi:uncharacterized membrane protein YsdA (DUF1294 family)
MRYITVFGALAAVLGMLLFLLLRSMTPWHFYIVWLVAWSVCSFVLYGLDKGLARAGGPRVPEIILNLLAVLGGFAGCWLGMAAFRHKSNFRKHPFMWAVLALSTVGHALWIYFQFLRQ